MPVKLTKCEYCACRFRVKKILKPWIGYYKGKPTYHWHYVCPGCNHVHFVRFYNEYVNPLYDKVIFFEVDIVLYKYDENKVKQLQHELNKVKEDLSRVNNEVKKKLKMSFLETNQVLNF